MHLYFKLTMDERIFKIRFEMEEVKLFKESNFWFWIHRDSMLETVEIVFFYYFLLFFRILKPALEMLFAESKFKAAPSFQFTKLQALPCGCPTVPFKESDKFLSKCWFVSLFWIFISDLLIDHFSGLYGEIYLKPVW